ncbi:MAG: hypothetical protein OEY59_10465 [Deltaproteobacteria bacterium]|nr:hypothetical protein [Deltaproteobacteria bacterium]
MNLFKTSFLLSCLLVLTQPVFAQDSCRSGDLFTCVPGKLAQTAPPPDNQTTTTGETLPPPPPPLLGNPQISPVGGFMFPKTMPMATPPGGTGPMGAEPPSGGEPPAGGDMKKPAKDGPGADKGKKDKKEAKKQKESKPKKNSTGVDVAFSSETQIFSVPYSYSFTDSFSLGVNLPYIATDSGSGMGNSSLAAKYELQVSNSFAAQLNAGMIFPTSSEDLGLSQTKDIQLGVSGFYQISRSRIFGAVSAILRQKVDTKDGDFSSLMVGFDTPLGFFSENINYYLAGQKYQTGEDFVDGVGQANEASYVDFIGGLVFLSYQFRLGILVPVSTDSDSVDNSDRDTYLDFGWRYSF